MKTLLRLILAFALIGFIAPLHADEEPTPSPVPLVLVVGDITVTVTAIYPDDGPMGSVTFDTPTESACGAVFLTSQNGKTVEEITEEDIIAAIAAAL